MDHPTQFVAIISANAEWQAVKYYFSDIALNFSPFGEWFSHTYSSLHQITSPVIFLHGGWGKVSASASTQYAIDRWHPKLLVNLGTCGGFEGMIERGQNILVEKTIIYDIFEQMGDPEEAITHYITELNIPWIAGPYPIPVTRTVLVSADRDLSYDDIKKLAEKYGAVAGDWESGAIAWVAAKNRTQCLILRGVTDLVGKTGSDAYHGDISYFNKSAELVMKSLVDSLPDWLEKYIEYH